MDAHLAGEPAVRVPGVFEPVEVLPPAQAISLTVLPSGMAKLEVGDMCFDLNPADCRRIGSLFRDSAEELAGLQNARELTDSVADLRRLQVAAAAREKDRDDAIRVPLQTETEFA